MHIIGTYTLSVSAGSIQSLYKGYCNVPCVLYTFGLFVFLKDASEWISKVNWLKKIIEIMGKYSFPVYLIHWFIIRALNDAVTIDTKSILYRLLIPYGIYIAIMLFVWCLRKIPGLRKIVP